MILLPTLYHTAPALSSQFHNIPICPAGLHGHFAQCPTGGQKNANFSQKYFKNPLTNPLLRGIICRRCEKQPHGGIAQLARATGSYPVGHRFKSGFRYQHYRFLFGSGNHYNGPVVKRLRHRPFTAVTRVRFPSGSPKQKGALYVLLFALPIRLVNQDPAKSHRTWHSGRRVPLGSVFRGRTQGF